MVAGPEFGPEEGKSFLVVKALCGLKSASFSFRSYMAEKLVSMRFQSSMADPDVWLWAATKSDGEKYYEYVLMYVDDILALSSDARLILEDIRGVPLSSRMTKSRPPIIILERNCKRSQSMA
jgi:hypothetical protein